MGCLWYHHGDAKKCEIKQQEAAAAADCYNIIMSGGSWEGENGGLESKQNQSVKLFNTILEVKFEKTRLEWCLSYQLIIL